MSGIVELDFLERINGMMIFLTCAIFSHTLRPWQTGVYKKSGEFKPDTIEGQPEPETTSYALGCEQELNHVRPFCPANSDVGSLPRLVPGDNSAQDLWDHPEEDGEGARRATRQP